VFRSVVVVVDGTTESDAALAQAACLAAEHGARLTLLGVAKPLPAYAGLAAVHAATSQGEYVEWLAQKLRQSASALPADLSVTTVLGEGSPTRVLRAEVGRAGHDLAVLGIQAPSGLARLLPLRAARVARRLPTAVLLLREPPKPARSTPRQPATGQLRRLTQRRRRARLIS
jgi:nucleotide-binding universal stress UspA family protein